eukprot:14813856-Ditylum_brightwellii.AAC.1
MEGGSLSEEKAPGFRDNIDNLKHKAQTVKANIKIGHGFYNKNGYYKNKPEKFFNKKNKAMRVPLISHNICGGMSGGNTPKHCISTVKCKAFKHKKTKYGLRVSGEIYLGMSAGNLVYPLPVARGEEIKDAFFFALSNVEMMLLQASKIRQELITSTGEEAKRIIHEFLLENTPHLAVHNYNPSQEAPD